METRTWYQIVCIAEGRVLVAQRPGWTPDFEFPDSRRGAQETTVPARRLTHELREVWTEYQPTMVHPDSAFTHVWEYEYKGDTVRVEDVWVLATVQRCPKPFLDSVRWIPIEELQSREVTHKRHDGPLQRMLEYYEGLSAEERNPPEWNEATPAVEDPIEEGTLGRSILDLELGVRAAEALMSLEIQTIGDLTRLDPNVLDPAIREECEDILSCLDLRFEQA
jgi:hypothetical protein